MIASAIAQKGLAFLEGDVALAEQGVARQCPMTQLQQVIPVKTFQHIDLTTREKRANHFKGGIFRCCTHKGDGSRFDSGKKRILLRLRETMDFIDEKNGTLLTEESVLPGLFDHFTHVLHSAAHSGKRIERGIKSMSYDFGQGGLPHPGRSPKDEGSNMSGINHLTQHGSRADQMLLSDIVVQRRGTHSFCQWLHKWVFKNYFYTISRCHFEHLSDNPIISLGRENLVNRVI